MPRRKCTCAEVDSLTKELGLAKVCEGPDTNIDAIRLAVDFAAKLTLEDFRPLFAVGCCKISTQILRYFILS